LHVNSDVNLLILYYYDYYYCDMTPERRNSGARREGRCNSSINTRHRHKDTHTTEELLEAVFSMRSVPMLHTEGHREKLVSEYLAVIKLTTVQVTTLPL
jgi:hypothetical protein